MRLGISSYTFGWAIGVQGHSTPEEPLTAMGLLNRAARLGVHLVQIADNLPLEWHTDRELDELAEHAAMLGVALEVGMRGCGPDYLLRYLEVARRLKSSLVRVVLDTADDRPSPDECARRLRKAAPEFERAGVSLAIENHDRFKASSLLQILDAVGSPRVAICFDTGNSFGCAEGPEAVLEVLGTHTINLHLKDFAVRRAGPNRGFVIEGRPAGQGQLDIPHVLVTLRQKAADPNAILELWTPPQATLAESLHLEDAWAAASIEYLRTLIPASGAAGGEAGTTITEVQEWKHTL
jgi:sugar phosphate isomerase/epimerase